MKELMPASRAVLTIETSLAGAVQSMSYGRNHHWLKLRDHHGREITLVENAVLRYSCEDAASCGFTFTSETNIGHQTKCNRCGKLMNQQWMRAQVALIPETQSDFEMPTKHNADRRAIEAEEMARERAVFLPGTKPPKS